ncbi:MAG TPA: hypothetical protein VIJ79_04525 [Acidobacteriaceae bacterium]
MGFWLVVFEVSIGGAVGGLLYWTSGFLTSAQPVAKADAPPSWKGDPSFCLASVFTGLGGAWAALLATLWANRAPLDLNTKDMLELLATSIIAGYAGNRLLPAVAERLTSELLKRTAANTQASAESAKVEADSARRSRMISEVLAYLDSKGNQTDHQTDAYVAQLQEELRQDPQFRQAALLLARMYAEAKNDYSTGIDVLQAFIDAKRRGGAKDDSNVADALWNMANYFECEFKTGGKTNRLLRQKAIEALAGSLRILPSYRNSLMDDDDFKELIADPEAKVLLG